MEISSIIEYMIYIIRNKMRIWRIASCYFENNIMKMTFQIVYNTVKLDLRILLVNVYIMLSGIQFHDNRVLNSLHNQGKVTPGANGCDNNASHKIFYYRLLHPFSRPSGSAATILPFLNRKSFSLNFFFSLQKFFLFSFFTQKGKQK